VLEVEGDDAGDGVPGAAVPEGGAEACGEFEGGGVALALPVPV
jgi:hypothetical protein